MAQQAADARAPRARSTRPRSSAFPRSPPNGGTRAARWRRCTSSIRCASAISATRRPPRFARDAKRLDSHEGPAHPRHRLRRRHAVRAAGAARRRRWSASIRPTPTSRRRRSMPRNPGLRSTTAAPRPRSWPTPARAFDIVLAMEVVEHVADVPLFVAELRRDGEARRADDRRHAQPHAEELRARDRRRRIHPALAAGRQPPLGQVRHAERAGDRDGAGRPAGDRQPGRDLQHPRRPLAALERHGRELHAGGGEAPK